MTKTEKLEELEGVKSEKQVLLELEKTNLEALVDSIREAQDLIYSYEAEIDRLESNIELLNELD